jgi:hypothetical protein
VLQLGRLIRWLRRPRVSPLCAVAVRAGLPPSPGPFYLAANSPIKVSKSEEQRLRPSKLRTIRLGRRAVLVPYLVVFDSKKLVTQSGPRFGVCPALARPLPARRPNATNSPLRRGRIVGELNKWLGLISLVIWSQEIRRLCRASLHLQKPKHHHDDGDADQCKERIARWIRMIDPCTPPASGLAADRDLDLVIGHGR